MDEGTIKVAYDPITRSFTCNPKQKSRKLREAAEDMRAAAEVEVDDVDPAAAGAETTKKKRTVKVQRTVVRYHSCQRTELVPVDFRGNIVESTAGSTRSAGDATFRARWTRARTGARSSRAGGARPPLTRPSS